MSPLGFVCIKAMIEDEKPNIQTLRKFLKCFMVLLTRTCSTRGTPRRGYVPVYERFKLEHFHNEHVHEPGGTHSALFPAKPARPVQQRLFAKPAYSTRQ